MLQLFLSLRFIMLLASFGAVLGALVMFGLGAMKLLHAFQSLRNLTDMGSKTVTVSVMGATDAFLFGLVLIIIACAIAFGFVLEPAAPLRNRLPRWMQIESIGQLKNTLVEVILVYLIVDFATDLAEPEGHLSWQTLVTPLSIILIAGALRLLALGDSDHGTQPEARGGD